MNLTELFIRRPVLAMVVSLLILLLGAQGLMNLQVRQYPEVKETTITVTTTYVGASAELMQGFISTPIAKAVSSAEGVDYVTSQSTARRQHGVGAHAPQHRPRCRAHRRHRQGAAGPRRSFRPTPKTR